MLKGQLPSKLNYTVLLLVSLSAAGCGGGGGGGAPSSTGNTDEEIDLNITTFEYSGSDSQATITSNNLLDIGVSIAQVTKNLGVEDVVVPSESVNAARADGTTQNAVIMDLSDPFCAFGGQSSHEYNRDRTINKYTLSDCLTYGKDRALDYYVTGANTVVYDEVHYGSFTSIFDGEILDEKGVTSSVHRTLRCTESDCQFVSDFYGDDGRVYRMSEIERRSLDRGEGIEFVGLVFDPEHGYVVVSETEIRLSFDCPNNNQPSVGKLLFADANGTEGAVEFVSCSQFIVSNGLTSFSVYWD